MAEDTQQSPLTDFNQLMPDPAALQGQVQDQWTARLAQAGSNPVMRNLLLQQMYGQRLQGGDPRVIQATQQKQAMMGIMQQVNENAPDNEDPLDYQERLSHAMLTGMAKVNPSVAMSAAQNLSRVQTAKQQRSVLSADVSLAQSKAAEAGVQAGLSKAVGSQIVLARPGEPDGNGMPTAPEAMATLDTSDPDFASKAAQMQSDAKKGGYQLVPMTPDQFMNGRGQIAVARGQFSLQAAQLRAQSAIQAALIRSQSQGGGMEGREAQMAYRMMSSAELGATALTNISEQKFGTNSGVFGIGKTPGESLYDAGRDALRNTLSKEDTQAYSAMVAGLGRNLSMLEAQGGLQGGQQLSGQMNEALALRPGDTIGTIFTKLAEAKQIITTATRVYLKNPKMPPEVQQDVQDTLTKLNGAIPYTVHDVTMFRQAQEKDPNLTFQQYASREKLGQQPGAAVAPPSAAASTVRIKLPDGRTGTIPASRLDAYKAQGATQVQ